MVDLVLRPSGIDDEKREWSLQLRYHDSCGPTEYATLCFVSRSTAGRIIKAGRPFWLFGPPDDIAKSEERILESERKRWPKMK